MLILTEETLKDCVEDLAASKEIDHDTETTGLFAFKKMNNIKDPGEARIAGHAFLSRKSKRKYYIPIRHETIIETTLVYGLPPRTTKETLHSVIEAIREGVRSSLGSMYIDLSYNITGFSETKKAQSKRQSAKLKIQVEAYIDDYDFVICETVRNVVDKLSGSIVSEELILKESTTEVYEGCWNESTNTIKNLSIALVNNAIRPIFEAEEKTFVGFNYKFDLSVMRFDDIIPKAEVQDVMVLCHLNQENEFNYRLKDLAVKYVDKNAKDQQDYIKEYIKKWKLKRYSQVPANLLGEYAEQDVHLTSELHESVMDEIITQNFTNLTVKDFEKNLVYKESVFLRLLDKIWYNGIPIDPAACRKGIEEADARSEELLKQAKVIVGVDVNLNSPVQLMKILGLTTTAKEALEESSHPLVSTVLEYRAWQKVKTTYYEVFLNDRDEQNRLHPDLFQIGTVTGRLSCRNPNLQALPRAKDDTDPFAHIYRVRNVIVPPGPDYALVFSDLSQAEMRIAAHYAKETAMIDIIKAGGDLHTQTAVVMFGDKCIDPRTGVPTKEYRNFAKRLNFGIIYGMGAKALAGNLGCSIEKAKELLDQYHEKFPGFKKLYASAEMRAIVRGWITMWSGRRRRFKGDKIEMWECRKAMNNLIQGSVSEMMKHAMIKVDKLFREETGDRSYIFNQVHDDLQMAVHKDDWHLVPIIRDIMQDHPWCTVPIITDTEYSLTSWGEKSKWKEGIDPWATKSFVV